MATIEERLAALEALVAEQQDRIEILQLLATYGPVVDAASSIERMGPFLDLWEKDGFYDLDGIGRLSVPDEAVASFSEFHFPMVANGLAHVFSPPVLTLEGDRAKAINYSTIFRFEDERFYPWRVGANLWELGKRDGKWRVLRRWNRQLNGNEEALALLGNLG